MEALRESVVAHMLGRRVVEEFNRFIIMIMIVIIILGIIFLHSFQS